MKKVVLIPDSFKGTMSSAQVCAVMARAIRAHHPHAQIRSIPVADGGEGSVDAFLSAVGGEKIEVPVAGPYGEPMQSFYGLLPDGTAVIEMAACAGLPLVEDRKNPLLTTTFGVGQLMKAAAERGCRKIILGIGGSCTNDGGAGLAAALGMRFEKSNGEPFMPTGGTLHEINRIDASNLAPELAGIQITAMCDVDIPLCGPTGAAHVFGPQKGADAEAVLFLDQGLLHLSQVIKQDLGKDILNLPGSGAAGGMGGGMAAFFGAELIMGINVVLAAVNFDEIAADADLVITGEGRMDEQSLRGKVVIGVAHRTKRLGIPLLAVVGEMADGLEEAYDLGVDAIFSINTKAQDFSRSRFHSEENLFITMDNLMRLIHKIKA